MQLAKPTPSSLSFDHSQMDTESNSIKRAARNYVAGKTRRELDRLVAERKVGKDSRKPKVRQLRSSVSWQKWEKFLLGVASEKIITQQLGRTVRAVGYHRVK